MQWITFNTEKIWDDGGEYKFVEIAQQYSDGVGISIGYIGGHATAKIYVRFSGERDIIVILDYQELGTLSYIVSSMVWALLGVVDDQNGVSP